MKISVPRFKWSVREGIAAISITLILQNMVFSQPVVKWWVSSQDMSKRLSSQPDAAFNPADSASKAAIQIDDKTTYQTIIGLGSSLEHSTCYNISKLPPEKQEDVIEKIVSPDKGIGMNLMRVCIGTPDFTASPWYSYDDMPPGKTDPQMKHFSIDKDKQYVLPILKLAQKINPDLKFFASPWSPPAWMKTNDNICGGRINPKYYRSFAEYLARSVEAYRAEGIDFIAITPQNEPEFFPNSYPTCGWAAIQQRDFIRDHLGPVFKERNLSTKIWCYDHNFNHLNFPATILKDPQAAQYIDGTAFHHYEGRPSTMSALHRQFPDKHIYFTEGSTFDIPGAVEIISFLRNWARCYNAWVTIIDHKAQPNPGPHDCSPTCIVLYSESLELEYRFDYYMYGQLMKFIRSGAIRIDSTYVKTLPNVAFQNPDLSIVLVVVNRKKNVQKANIQWNKKYLQVDLGSESIATFMWKQ